MHENKYGVIKRYSFITVFSEYLVAGQHKILSGLNAKMTTQKMPAMGTATQFHSQEEENGQTHKAPNRADDQGR